MIMGRSHDHSSVYDLLPLETGCWEINSGKYRSTGWAYDWLESVHINRSVSQQAEREQMLAGLVARLHSQPDLDLTYQSTCQGITTALAIETGFILGYEENSRSYRLAKVLHDGAWHPVQHYPVFPASIIEAVVPKDGTPLVISGFQAREHLQEQGFSPVNLPAVILLTALNHQGNKNGVLGACANDRERIFSPEEIHFAQDFANRAALAITHSHLFAAIKKQDLFMQLVHKITRITLDNANLEEMLAQVAREVVDTLPIEGCYIGLWEQRKKNLTPRAAAGPNKALFLKRAIAPELAHIIEIGAQRRTGSIRSRCPPSCRRRQKSGARLCR